MNPATQRENIQVPYNKDVVKEIEAFQNEVLRPALKLLHDKLLLLYTQQSSFRKAYRPKAPLKERIELINRIYTEDIHFKNVVKGMVLACLNEAEIAYFMLNERELTKRINNLAAQRLSSSADSDLLTHIK